MLIKPPGTDKQDLVTSTKFVQALNIPATVKDLLGFSVSNRNNVSFFDNSSSGPNEIHFFAGDKKWIGGKKWTLGENMKETDLMHFSYEKDKGWHVYPNINGKE